MRRLTEIPVLGLTANLSTTAGKLERKDVLPTEVAESGQKTS